MTKRMKVFYASSEYDCCGSYFSVGEYVWWHTEKLNVKDKIGNREIKIDNYCVNCSGGGDRMVSGLITKIELIDGNTIKVTDSSKEKFKGDYLVTLTNVEEFFYSDIEELNFTSNPFITNKKLNEDVVYTNINIIGDMNENAIDIAKKFNESHFGINFYFNDTTTNKEVYNRLKNIRSYSNNEYFNIDNYDIKKSNVENFVDSLNIIISEDNDYNDIYNFLLKIQKESYSTLHICFIRRLDAFYEIYFDFSKLSKNILDILKYKKENNISKNIKSLNIYHNFKLSIKSRDELIRFVSDKIYRNIKIVNYKKRLLFFVLLWIIIKIITFIVRY